MDQNATPIIDALREFDSKKITSYDVPGHKRGIREDDFQKLVGKEVFLMDVNSPIGTDHFSHPKGVIKESLELAAEAYKADNAFYLVNGSSSGVQIMIMTVCYDGEKILIPRNAHKSVTNALILSGAVPVFMEPEINQHFGIASGMTLKTIQKHVEENPDAKALFLVYPTYYGACADLEQIIEYAHSKDIVVMVDQAHGAHFSFSSALPKSAAELGADLVVASTHKTGGSLTQSAMLLHNEGLVKYHSIKKRVLMFHTTSPSYLLMASLESSRKLLATQGEEIFGELVHECRKLKKEISKIPGLSVLDEHEGVTTMTYDPTKIVINVTKLGLDGFDVYDIMFEKYGIQMELAEPTIVLAVIGIGDTKETIWKLADAFKDLSETYYGKYEMLDIPEEIVYVPPQIMSPRQAFYADKISIPIGEAVGHVAAEAVMIYPPGIPICIPGELITAETIDEILYCQENSNCVQKDSKEADKILVVDDGEE
ncbi:Arginine decarboxylase [Methanimicrococcus stummii]|uniref:Arginine decarboxylase n=1 Tax=Methanimicrococcus stummii TaxID=3028294 RepID=A0AA96VB53_9EURY|nr:aminotransferase class I/II-fold pyridoxal phosphate-dependent enzyme [Methanimicrococcus sp. Es2]WNY28653.1 Arginine decarboxylase [Methanimicrococcus sp. Es2]